VLAASVIRALAEETLTGKAASSYDFLFKLNGFVEIPITCNSVVDSGTIIGGELGKAAAMIEFGRARAPATPVPQAPPAGPRCGAARGQPHGPAGLGRCAGAAGREISIVSDVQLTITCGHGLRRCWWRPRAALKWR
jgi:hypothetical protein